MVAPDARSGCFVASCAADLTMEHIGVPGVKLIYVLEAFISWVYCRFL